MDSSIDESVPVFLTDLLAPEEKKGKKGKAQNWDTRKNYTETVSGILDSGTVRHQKLSARMQECAKLLIFGWALVEAGVNELKFRQAWFCRVRTCPICQWRRSQMLLARFFDAFPRIREDYPTTRYVFLTLTVANCSVTELKETIKAMNKAWDRLAKRKVFPAIGYIRSLEVTRAKDGKAHPHFHILLALKPTYFVRGNYLSTEKWAELWQNSLRADYMPVCDVRIVKARKSDKRDSGQSESELEGIKAAIVEVIKYTVKPADMVKDEAFLLELVNQLHKVRSVSLGGIFKHYLQEEDESEESGEENQEIDTDCGLAFGWRQTVKRYQLNPPKGS